VSKPTPAARSTCTKPTHTSHTFHLHQTDSHQPLVPPAQNHLHQTDSCMPPLLHLPSPPPKHPPAPIHTHTLIWHNRIHATCKTHRSPVHITWFQGSYGSLTHKPNLYKTHTDIPHTIPGSRGCISFWGPHHLALRLAAAMLGSVDNMYIQTHIFICIHIYVQVYIYIYVCMYKHI